MANVISEQIPDTVLVPLDSIHFLQSVRRPGHSNQFDHYIWNSKTNNKINITKYVGSSHGAISKYSRSKPNSNSLDSASEWLMIDMKMTINDYNSLVIITGSDTAVIVELVYVKTNIYSKELMTTGLQFIASKYKLATDCMNMINDSVDRIEVDVQTDYTLICGLSDCNFEESATPNIFVCHWTYAVYNTNIEVCDNRSWKNITLIANFNTMKFGQYSGKLNQYINEFLVILIDEYTETSKIVNLKTLKSIKYDQIITQVYVNSRTKTKYFNINKSGVRSSVYLDQTLGI